VGSGEGQSFSAAYLVNFTGNKSPGDNLSFPVRSSNPKPEEFERQVDLAGGGGRYRLSPGRLNLDSSAELYRATETNPEDVGGVLLTQTDIPLSVPNDNPDPPFRSSLLVVLASSGLTGRGSLRV